MSVSTVRESDAIAFIHTADADPWAMFLKNKLCSDSYKIHTFSHGPELENTADMIQTSKTSAVLVSPNMLENDHSFFWNSCVDHFNSRTVILLLGVDRNDLRNSLGFPLCDRVLLHQVLEVDGSQEAVTHALVKLIEVFESADGFSFQSLESLHINSVSVSDAADEVYTECEPNLYKDDKFIYDYPPPPRQQNSIVRIIPTVLYEHSSLDVLLLMERDAEDTLTMVTESGCGPSRHIHLEHIRSGAYIATFPKNLNGEINFSLMAGERVIGRGSVHVYSRMDQLQHILKTETHPLTLLCNSMGIQENRGFTAEELDTALARRLIDVNFPADLKCILKIEEESDTDQEDCRWPTLLHFAAEFNLKRVCEELLRFPGMIHAACTENNEGLFPCQLAEKGGFRNLQKRLVLYVEDSRLRRSAADSGISFSENMPPPERHSSTSPYYVNETEIGTFDEDYIDMNPKVSFSEATDGVFTTCEDVRMDVFMTHSPKDSLLPPPPACHIKVNDGYAKPRSFSEGCVKTPYARQPSEAIIAEEEGDSKENNPPPLKPKVSRAMSVTSTHLFPKLASPLPPRPDSGSSEDSDSKSQEVLERTSKSSTETLTCRLSEVGEVEGAAEGTSQFSSRPPSHSSTSSFESEAYDEEHITQDASSHPDSSVVPVLRGGKRSKISNFFHKMKPSSRKHLHSASDGDLPIVSRGSKKSVLYTRGSTSSTSSDPSGYKSSALSLKSLSFRHSGAVCDDPDSVVVLRGQSRGSVTPRNSGKRNGTSMQRRISVRIQRAQKEELGETPTLPSRRRSGTTRETFVSHIKDDPSETSTSPLQGKSAGTRETFISHVKDI